MVGIMDGESLRTQGARFGRPGSFFVENVRKPEKISFGRLVINKINNQGGLISSYTQRVPPNIACSGSGKFLLGRKNHYRNMIGRSLGGK